VEKVNATGILRPVDDRIAVIRGFYDAWSRRDTEHLRSQADPEIVADWSRAIGFNLDEALAQASTK